MVHEQVRPLLALALEGLERAKLLFLFRLAAHCVALGFAITAAVAENYHDSTAVECGAAIVAIAFEFAALCLHHMAMHLHSTSRQAMRRVMLLDALHPEEAEALVDKVRSHFGKGVQQRAAALEERDRQLPEKERRLANYYWSPKPAGQARLRDHLFESAIFSQHLYGAAWKFSLLCMILLLAAAVAILAFLVPGAITVLVERTHHSADSAISTLIVRLMIALVAFLPACQELDHLLLYRLVEKQLGELLNQLETLYSHSLADDQPNTRLLADFGDYCAATTFAPPIRTVVYRTIGQQLAREFEEKMRSLGESSGSGP